MRFFVLALFLCLSPAQGNARAVKLGDSIQTKQTFGSQASATIAGAAISCLETDNCPYDKECVSLQCESVCKSDFCSAGTHCAALPTDPHKPQCVECTEDNHCPRGMFCNQFACKKLNPCLNAVCSPAAPFCKPEPYQSLPYTCVQCLENSHCPPIAGLTRKCVDGYCLFNVEGNLPAPKQTPAPAANSQRPASAAAPPPPPPAAPEPSAKAVDEEAFDDDEYEDEEEYDED